MHPDEPRLQRLLNEYFERLHEEVNDSDDNITASDIAIDEAMIITIIARHHEGGIEERPVTICTSTRGFVQLGMLESAIDEQKRKMNPYLNEESESED